MSRKALVVGNWKMWGDLALIASMQEALPAASFPHVDAALCPPNVYLAATSQALSGSQFAYGAQDACMFGEDGAYTGQVSARMFKEVGCSYVIVGHSERREMCGEDDTIVGKKALNVLEAGMTPIVCVGESLAEYESSKSQEVALRQLNAVIEIVGVSHLAQLVLAYEPVWAIGTGLAATPLHANEVHTCLRERLASFSEKAALEVRILYGGSVKESNAQDLFSQPEVDGGLIGGASLDAQHFLSLCQIAESIAHANSS